MNKPAAYMSIYIDDEGDKSTMFCTHKDQYIENQIPLYTHPANACKHGVDDGACKECYLESTHTAELTDEEIDELHKLHTTLPPKPWKGVPLGSFDVYEFARAILRKAGNK